MAFTEAMTFGQSFSQTGSMNLPRSRHTATLLDSGLVLVTGGEGAAARSAEIYNPSTGLWRLVSSMNFARLGHSATKLPNGEVLVAGGFDGSNHLASAEIFNPSTEQFRVADPMPAPKTDHRAVLLRNGRVFVVGGLGAVTATFDPSQGSDGKGKWIQAMPVPDQPQYANGSTATLLDDDRVLFIEGGSGAALAVWLYNPATDSWVRGAALQEPRQMHTADLLPNHKVLIAGGQHGQCNISDTVKSSELFDAAANGGNGQSAFGPSLLARREQHTGTILPNGDVLLIGGQQCNGPPNGLAATAERFNTESNEWVSAGSPLEPRYSHTATLLRSGRVLVVGGYSSTNSVADNRLSSAELWPAGAPNECGLQPTLSGIRPNRGGNGGTVTVTIEGCGFTNGAVVKLTRTGSADIAGTIAGVSQFGTTMNVAFDLTGALAGLSDVAVALPGMGSLTMSQAFTIEQGGTPDVRTAKTGTTAVPGRLLDYFILVENRGNVNASGVVAEALEPWFTFDGASPSPAETRQGRDTFPDSPPSATYTAFLYWPYVVAPGETRLLSYRARLDPQFIVGDEVRGCACNTPNQEQAQACTDVYEVEMWRAKQQPNQQVRKTMELLACRNLIVCCGGGDTDIKQARGATDPNEKLTSHPKFILPDQRLTYPIHFENVGNAEARDVYIVDVLDPNLDLSSVQLLTPGATLDTTTRTLKWTLLKKNLPPQGTDNVLVSIKPKPNLPSGTMIKNRATIQFEVFPPMTTNETLNIIDSTSPVCTMTPLPAQTTTPDISLSWTGADAVGEIDSYSVFVSVNGGPFTSPIQATRNTSGIFKGEVGKTYGFFCTATDTVGNVQPSPAAPTTTTTVVAPQACASNITSQFTITPSGFRRNNSTGRWLQTVTITRNAANFLPTPGPFALALDGLSKCATLYGSTVTTSCAVPTGSPLLEVKAGSTWDTGKSVTVNIEFLNPTNAAISYTPRLLGGSESR